MDRAAGASGIDIGSPATPARIPAMYGAEVNAVTDEAGGFGTVE